MKGRKGRSGGGKVEDAGGNKEVMDEAKERKRGGRIPAFKDGGKVMSGKAKFRMDRPGRKKGGRVGANNTPLSTANASVSGAPGSPNPNG